MKFPTYQNEKQKISEGYLIIAGCDEVGRGPLAGPVVAGCVILDPQDFLFGKNKWWARVRDSKTIRERERGELDKLIREHAIDFSVGVVEPEMIDEINILQASLLAMKKSVDGLKKLPDYIFVDGSHQIKNLSVPQGTHTKGDTKIISIAAASIIAKVARDEMMRKLHLKYPQYGFMEHKGYGTKFHREAIRKFGLTKAHRISFANAL